MKIGNCVRIASRSAHGNTMGSTQKMCKYSLYNSTRLIKPNP